MKIKLLNRKNMKSSLVAIPFLLGITFSAHAGISETTWDFAKNEVVQHNNSEIPEWAIGGPFEFEGEGYLCPSFVPQKVSFHIYYEVKKNLNDGNINNIDYTPEVDTGGTGKISPPSLFKETSDTITNIIKLEGIEKLAVNFWNGGGVYEIQNVTDSIVHGKNCTAGLPSRNDRDNRNSVYWNSVWANQTSHKIFPTIKNMENGSPNPGVLQRIQSIK